MLWTGEGTSPDQSGAFSESAYLDFNDGKLNFDNRDVADPNDNYGAGSGFLPKSLIPK